MIVVFIRRNARWLLRPTVLDGLLLAEMDGLNNVIKEYIYLAGQLLAVRDFSRGFGEMYYAHTDHLGMPRLLTNNIGQTAWRGEFDPFGKTVSINEDVDGDGFDVSLNIRFPGQYYDAETGLHYNWNRYYDPEIGQYTSVDPIGLAGGLNVYTYVGGNPVGFVDPDGLEVVVGKGAIMPTDKDLLGILRKLDQRYSCKDVVISRDTGNGGGGTRTAEQQENIRPGSGYGTDGKKISDHVEDRAADISINGVSAREIADAARNLGASGTIPYTNHAHIDTNPNRQYHPRPSNPPRSQ